MCARVCACTHQHNIKRRLQSSLFFFSSFLLFFFSSSLLLSSSSASCTKLTRKHTSPLHVAHAHRVTCAPSRAPTHPDTRTATHTLTCTAKQLSLFTLPHLPPPSSSTHPPLPPSTHTRTHARIVHTRSHRAPGTRLIWFLLQLLARSNQQK